MQTFFRSAAPNDALSVAAPLGNSPAEQAPGRESLDLSQPRTLAASHRFDRSGAASSLPATPPRSAKRLVRAALGASGLLAIVAIVAMMGAGGAAQAATLTVTNTADTGAGSLRGQMVAAVAGDTIAFDAALFSTPQTINTASTLSLNKSLTITGPGARLLAVRRNTTGTFAIFTAISPTVRVSGMTVSNGNNQSGGGSAFNTNGSSANLTIDSVALTGNVGAESAVGGFTGSVTITNSLISNNSVCGVVAEGGTITITNSTISGNNGTGPGVAGGIYNVGVPLNLNNVTIANNINGGIETSGGTTNIRNTLVTGSTTRPDAIGAFVSQGNNLVSNVGTATSFSAGNNDKLGVAAGLAALANNDGSTDTHALNAGSAAINAGNSCVTSSSCGVNNPPANLTTDQRGPGFPRIAGSSVDIGAFEVQGPTVTTPTSANITQTSATLGGNVTSDNGATVTERGVVYAPTATNSNPLIGGTGVLKATAGGTTGVFTVAVTGLTPGTGYSFKAYATNANGTSYSSVATFTTLADPAQSGPNYTVTKVADTNDGACTAGDCSLREAIRAANATTSNDTITVPAGTYTLAITGVSEDAAATGDLDVTATSGSGTLVINGAGLGTTFVEAGTTGGSGGNGIDRVFEVRSSGNLTVSGLTIRNGRLSGPGIFGGGIINRGSLAVQRCSISNNFSMASGGGLNNEQNAVMIVRECTMSDNSAANGAGAINNSGTLTVQNSTLSGNTNAGTNGGGAIFTSGIIGNLTVQGCTLSGNTTSGANSSGGAILANGTVTVQNSTLSGNSAAAFGGAIATGNSGGVVTVQGCTLSGNSAMDGGGLSNFGTINLSNSIVAGNSITTGTGPDIRGTISSQGFNLIGKTDGGTVSGTLTGNQTGTIASPLDPQLSALANNGGTVLTQLIFANSPAKNAGSNALIPADTLDADGDSNTTEPLPFDARGVGFPRLVDATVDIGAFEALPNNLPVFGNSTYNFIFTQNRVISGARVLATDSDGDALTFALSGGALPAGVTFNSDGTFSGTPTATSPLITRTVTVSDGKGGTATASVTIQVSADSGAIISEFRFRGPGGTADEYVEIHNTTGAPLSVAGWKLRTSTGPGVFQTATVGAGVMIPARGHLLFTGTGYSLGTAGSINYGAGDLSLGADASDNSGALLLDASNAVQDAVGFATSDITLREGAGLPSAPNVNGTPSSQYAFMRDFVGVVSKDSSDSSNDFVFVSTSGAGVAGTNGTIASQLGAPSPEGLASPINSNNLFTYAILDPATSQTLAPNRVRTGVGNAGNLLIRRTLTNSSTRVINRLRMQVTFITGLGTPGSVGSAAPVAGQADVRLIGSGTETVRVQGQDVTVYGTLLEAPSNPTSTTGTAPNTVVSGGGGGLGSSIAFDLLLATPLQPGQSRAYAFNLQVAKSGSFVVAFNVLANTTAAP